MRDNRYYIVKYTDEKTQKSRFINVTDLNVMVDDLKPNTLYDFSVKLVKGKATMIFPFKCIFCLSFHSQAAKKAPGVWLCRIVHGNFLQMLHLET